ncbi:hypothetical protein [Microcystis sp. M169S2]|uniref:hypothetical protein n=1 Tax=Microcystis sp. M169S2 TaxID=2771157 RepID=UPI00258A7E9F|nr:hypothetical protein [Microcystis sp. M169S2]
MATSKPVKTHTPHPTPHTPHPAPTNKLFQQTLDILIMNAIAVFIRMRHGQGA